MWEGERASGSPSVSANGRYVAFVSQGFDLVPGITIRSAHITGRAAQVYVRDLRQGRTMLASRGVNGEPASLEAIQPSISGDGRYVAFVSVASNLVAHDTKLMADVFVRDLVEGRTTRVSVSSSGEQANNISGSPAISADGRHVAFYSAATNLVEGITNGEGGLFVHDRVVGATSRLPTPPCAMGPTLSSDGRYLVFFTQATDQPAGAPNEDHVFLHDRDTQMTKRISATGTGEPGDGPSMSPVISPNSRYVAYDTAADNLLGFPKPAHPDAWHVLCYDRATGKVEVVTHAADGLSLSPRVSDHGAVAFVSLATNLTPRWPSNGVWHAYAWDPGNGSFTKLSADDAHGQANADCRSPAISADGSTVAFVSKATNLADTSSDAAQHVFAYTRTDDSSQVVLVSAPDSADDESPPLDTDTQ